MSEEEEKIMVFKCKVCGYKCPKWRKPNWNEFDNGLEYYSCPECGVMINLISKWMEEL